MTQPQKNAICGKCKGKNFFSEPDEFNLVSCFYCGETQDEKIYPQITKIDKSTTGASKYS